MLALKHLIGRHQRERSLFRLLGQRNPQQITPGRGLAVVARADRRNVHLSAQQDVTQFERKPRDVARSAAGRSRRDDLDPQRPGCMKQFPLRRDRRRLLRRLGAQLRTASQVASSASRMRPTMRNLLFTLRRLPTAARPRKLTIGNRRKALDTRLPHSNDLAPDSRSGH